MTDQEIDAMKAGRELDALKVMQNYHEFTTAEVIPLKQKTG